MGRLSHVVLSNTYMHIHEREENICLPGLFALCQNETRKKIRKEHILVNTESMRHEFNL